MIPYSEYKEETTDTFDPSAMVAACIENGHDALLLESKFLPQQFFDLSNGLMGALVHRLSLYEIKLAVVIPDTTIYSHSFQDFVREANKGNQFRFVSTREEAIAWLSGT